MSRLYPGDGRLGRPGAGGVSFSGRSGSLPLPLKRLTTRHFCRSGCPVEDLHGRRGCPGLSGASPRCPRPRRGGSLRSTPGTPTRILKVFDRAPGSRKVSGRQPSRGRVSEGPHAVRRRQTLGSRASPLKTATRPRKSPGQPDAGTTIPGDEHCRFIRGRFRGPGIGHPDRPERAVGDLAVGPIGEAIG